MGLPELQQLARELMPILVEELRKDGMAIVRTEELEEIRQVKLAALRREYLKRRALTLKEIIDAQLLPRGRSRTSLMRLINDTKTFKKGEAFQNSKDEWMITTGAIKRIAPEWQ